MTQNEHATVAALDAARTVFRAEIAAHRGRIIDTAGDSVLAVFDIAAGAVAAALSIQNKLEVASESVAADRRMHFRIGVHLGDVIEKHDGTVYGDGVNIAARLQALAEPGGIVVSDAVRGVLGGRIDVAFKDLGEQRLRHIAAPLRAFAVVVGGGDDGAAAAPPPAAPRHPVAADAPGTASRARPPEASLFVGRQQELIDLTRALEGARHGRGQVVLLAGSGGMGKTRLAQQLAARAESAGVRALWGRCLEEPGAPPYWPWRQLVRSYLRTNDDASWLPTLGAGLADIASIVPELAEKVALPTAQAEAGDSAQSRFRLFDAVAGFWRRAARQAPQVLIFEDLHWADATSLRLFTFLAAELEDSAILMVGTYRDTELSRQHPLSEALAELARSSAFQRIELGGLTAKEAEQLMVAATGGTASAGFVSALYARTEGHPLFLEETLRLVTDPRALGPLAAADDLRLLTKIPVGVREVIGRRLNRLSVTASRLLSIAACIGRTFDLELLQRLEPDKSEDEILEALEEALAAHLIEPVPETQQLRFGHALIRETLYDEMLGLRRSRLHLRIGEMLEERHGAEDPTLLPQLAYHFSEAGAGPASAKALAYARSSAEQAERVLAYEEATRLFRLALALQQRHFAKDEAARCELLIAAGRVETTLGAGEPARVFYQEAADLARKLGLGTLFAQAAAGFEQSNTMAARSGGPAVMMLSEAIALHQQDDSIRVELLARLARAYIYCDQADEAKETFHRTVRLARRIDDRHGLYLTLASITSAGFWPDMLQERLAAAREAWGIAESLDLPLESNLLPFYLCDLVRSGDVETLGRIKERGLVLADRARSPYVQSLCRHIEALIAIGEGRFADAERWAMQALEVGRRAVEDLVVSAYGMQMFCLRREQGRLREALPMLHHFVKTSTKAQTWQPGLALLYAELGMTEECRAEFDALPWPRTAAAPRDASTMTTMVFAAEACILLGDAGRATLLYQMLGAHAGANLLADSSGPYLGSADRMLGSLATLTAQWDIAEPHFEAALAMDAKTGSRVWLAHSRFAYAVMLHRRAAAGDLDRARALLVQALAESTALAMNAMTPRISALLETIASPPPAWPCGLTEREVGVLRLMAIGRNNREIGMVLSISPNTVANHVGSILEKTYTANRTEAAGFARREGLLED